MLADIRIWTLLIRSALLAAWIAVGASHGRHHPPRPHGPRWRAARLAAQVALIDPELGKELRQVTGRIARLARALEAELHRLRRLEARLEEVVRQVEDSSGGEEIDEKLFERLAERFGLLRVRPALQRLEEAHPDAPSDGDRSIHPGPWSKKPEVHGRDSSWLPTWISHGHQPGSP